MKTTLTTLLFLIICSCSVTSTLTDNEKALLTDVKQHGEDPVLYITSKFKDHDVVFFGEHHYLKEQVVFVKELLPHLYKSGVYCLGTEFIRYSDTAALNSLITADTFDEKLARELSFRSLWHWGYQEYIDIYREAWKLNKSLPDGAAKFRIFGIEEDMDFSYVNKEEDLGNPEIMAKVFKGSSLFEEDEGFSADVIMKETVVKKQKAIIHCGIHHAFTSYYQPGFNQEERTFNGHLNKERAGNIVKRVMQGRAITIFVHGPWPSDKGYDSYVLPAEGTLDKVFYNYGAFGLIKGYTAGAINGKEQRI